MSSDQKRLTRPPHHGHHEAADFSELFFDLVYVFAVTQLAHHLLEHHDLAGIIQTAIMFLAVWWAWVFTTWACNWLDPTRAPNRLMLFAVMLASLVMSASIPRAFEDRAIWFAAAYVAIQVLRTLYIIMVSREERPNLSKAMTPTLVVFSLTGALWIGGALMEGAARYWIWAAALVIEYALPIFLARRTPDKKSDLSDFEVTGAHMAERCGLFIIIALGEGILITGATFADLEWRPATVAAFLIAFTGSVAMWWVYFDIGARRGAAHIAENQDSGRIARDAYTYAHVPIVAGVILTAMGDEMVLAHPTGHLDPALAASGLGGLALFLTGTMFFKRITSGSPWFPLSHLIGLGLLALAGLWAWLGHPSPLAIAAAGVIVMLVVALWEWGSFHGGWVERGVPQPEVLRRRADKLMARKEAMVQETKKAVPPKDD